MSGRTLRFGFWICLLAMAACLPGTTMLHAAEGAAGKAPKAVIKTKLGDMEIVFFPDKAPNHVQNFIKLARRFLSQKRSMQKGTQLQKLS